MPYAKSTGLFDRICDGVLGFQMLREGKAVYDIELEDLVNYAIHETDARSATEAAYMIGVTPQVLDQWRRGISLPSDENMIRLANFLKINSEQALVLLNYWRSEQKGYEAAAKAYKAMADRFVDTFKKYSGAAAIVLCVGTAWLAMGTDRAQAAVSARGLYIMENIGVRFCVSR